MRGFFKGFSISILRTIPFSAFGLFIYEGITDYLKLHYGSGSMRSRQINVWNYDN